MSPARLDATFAALADSTRRAILARLASGEASVNELAKPFEMSQPAISKHLKVLERAGLISRGIDAQRRPRRLEAKPLAEATEWLERYREFWGTSFGRLDTLLDELKAKGPKPRRAKEELAMNDTLQITTPADREILITRVFDAPRSLVFDCMTKPELVRRWLLGPPGWTMPVCEIDLKVGGRFRYVWRRENGTEMGMGGVYREIVPPERIVQTELFDQDWTGGETISTARLVELDGRTTLTTTVIYSSKDARDGALRTGMTEGLKAGYAKLDELLASL